MRVISDGSGSNDRGQMVTQRQIDEYPTATTAIVDALASAEEVDPFTLQSESGICLFDHINPDAMERILTRDQENCHVRVNFTIGDYEVRIARRRVAVYKRDLPGD